MIGYLALIVVTWVLAIALLAPYFDHFDSLWALPAVLLLGASGSIVAVCIS